MERNEIVEILTPIFQDAFSEPNLVIKDDLSANDVDNWNSLTNMTMTDMVEQRFNIHFKLKELKKMENVGDLIAAIQEKI